MLRHVIAAAAALVLAAPALHAQGSADYAVIQKAADAYLSSLAANDFFDVIADDVHERMKSGKKDFVVVDGRVPKDKKYDLGHLPGALNIPHDEIARRWTALNARRDQEIVLYCHSGRRAGLAQQALEKLDFSHTRLLDGSIQAWQAAGLPLRDEHGPEPKHD